MWPFTPGYPEVKLIDVSEEYDFIVIGGGTAGCILANRLSADPSLRVLLVERGGVADSWASRVPLFSSDYARSGGARASKTLSEPQSSMGKTFKLFTGKALGGTSRINAMLYTRGLPAEYDAWRDAGRQGWGWADLKPYFLKSEHATYVSDPAVHNRNGEWCNTTDSTNFQFSGFQNTVDACRDIGLPYIDDLNSPEHPPFGCGALHLTRDSIGHRSSAYDAFMPKSLALKRSRTLHICTNTVVSKIETELLPDGRRLASGARLIDSKGNAKVVRAAREVVVCAGAFGSPQVLLLSGIGPSGHLKDLDIQVVKDLPGVGSNLQDHFGVSISFSVPVRESIVVLEKRPWVFLIELIRYLIFGTGMLLAPFLQLAIFSSFLFVDSKGMPSLAQRAKPESLPDLEIMPMVYETSDELWDKSHGVYSFLNVLLRPHSRGTVRLTSADPSAPLSIDPRYLSDARDFVPLRASVRLSLRISERMQARGYPMESWRLPDGEDDAALDKHILRRNRTTYHYSSTCRMAPEHDPNGGGVVNDELFVYGFTNLRVADSSIFPWIPSTHLQAPTAAVAEKCADMILTGDRKAE